MLSQEERERYGQIINDHFLGHVREFTRRSERTRTQCSDTAEAVIAAYLADHPPAQAPADAGAAGERDYGRVAFETCDHLAPRPGPEPFSWRELVEREPRIVEHYRQMANAVRDAVLVDHRAATDRHARIARPPAGESEE